MNKNVKCVPFDRIDNAYIVISAHKASPDSTQSANGVEKCMSFFYHNGGIGAEWEPNYGPITVIYECAQNDKRAIPHWFYDYYTGQGNWSQLAVDEEGLPDAFLEGDYERLFSILKSWSER